MSRNSYWTRCKRRYQRTAATILARRPFTIRNRAPLISFTFDDFPRSAFYIGGGILESFGVAGTYYASIGLMGQNAPTGPIFTDGDLSLVLSHGHELGCHTYSHCHSTDTSAERFDASVVENRESLRRLAPDACFTTLSYPIGCPRPATKARIAKYFLACRGGGQTYNQGTVDLNHLQAFFIEQSREHPDAIRAVINANCTKKGWLIFATHDVCESPTPYGCTPALFEEIVEYSIRSGAQVVPVSAALDAVGVPRPERL